MAKYKNANKALRKVIIQETGLSILKNDDEKIIECAEIVAKKYNLPAKELVRMYRHHCHKIRHAYKLFTQENCNIKSLALDLHICFKSLNLYIQEKNKPFR